MIMRTYRQLGIRVIIPFLVVLMLVTLGACGASATATPAPVPTTAAPAPQAAAAPAAAPTVAPKAVAAPTAVPQAAAAPTAAPKAAPPGAAAGSQYWKSLTVGAKYGGTLRNGVVAEPDHWDLHQACCNPAAGAARDLYNALIMFHPSNQTELVGDLAESWEWSKDGLSLTLRIRENAKWHDGVPVTSEDIVFSLDRMVQEGKSRPRVKNIKPYYAGAEVIDPRTVKVKVKFPTPAAFLPFLAVDYMVILPKHILAGRADAEKYFDAPENIVGSGAYKFVSYDRGSRWELEKNQDYFKEGLPFVERRITNLISDPSRLAVAIEAQQVMLTIRTMAIGTQVGVTLRDTLEKKGIGTVYWLRETAMGMFQMNWTKPPLSDPKVRRAVYLAVDGQELINVAALGNGSLGTPFFPNTWMSASEEEVATWPGFRYVDASGKPTASTAPGAVKDPRDIEEAKRLMTEAGYPDGFKADYHTSFQSKTEALTLKEQLKKIGIDLTLNITDTTTAIAAEQAGAYGTFLSVNHGTNLVDPDDLFGGVYLAGGPRNPLKFDHPRLREIFELQKREPDQKKRRAILKEAEDIIRQGEMHQVTFYWFSIPAWAVNKKIKNFVPPHTAHYGMNTEHLWIDE